MDSREVVKKYAAGELRGKMPTITAWLDDMRSAFGAETINAAIRGGIAGKPTFYAEEGGVTIGTPRPTPWGVCPVDDFLRLIELGKQ